MAAGATYYYIGSGQMLIGSTKVLYGQAVSVTGAELKKYIQLGLVSAIPTQLIERSRNISTTVVTKEARPKWPGGWSYPASALSGMTLAQKNGLVGDGAILLDSAADAETGGNYPFTVDGDADTFLTTGVFPGGD